MPSLTPFLQTLLSAIGTQADSSALSLFTRSGTVATIDLIIIAIFSILSWGIVFYKIRLIRASKKNSQAFYRIFNKTKHEKLSRIYTALKAAGESHISNVFQAGYYELVDHCRTITTAATASGISKEDLGIKLLNENIHILERTLSKSVSDEVNKLEQGLFFLATTGSTTPFLGLFGTIWGVMNAFSAIGLNGNPNLANIAPGISDALITTGAGLIAAIPAVVAYNLFNNSIKILISDMENFSLDFLSLVEKKLS